MDSFETECRRLTDGLVREILALAAEVARDAVATARAERREAERAVPRVSPRLARALERAEERRRLAAERRAASAMRPSSRRQKAVASARAADVSEDEQAPAAIAPKPLFVHKRSRDGSIQQLERTAAESAPPPA
jgi:hypothetical protein